MKKIGTYLFMVLIITILLPTVIVKTFSFAPRDNLALGDGFDETDSSPKIKQNIIEKLQPIVDQKELDSIKLLNPYTDVVTEIPLEEYIKGVVAAEMPAAFHIEALKAQAIAARTYAISRTVKYVDGHPNHKSAPLCKGVHCQDYLSLDELTQIHGDSWVENYWAKIGEAVDSTKGLLIYYDNAIVEPLYHSTSGGMTEDAINVFASDTPYLKAVISPYEEEAPKYKTITTLTGDEFVNKINSKYPDAKVSKDNIHEKIKLIEKTASGRIKKAAIDKTVIDGKELRDLFSLNSTNFTIAYDKKLNIIDITTFGYGHGVGMSQWGANGMAKNGSSFIEILKHYYTGVEIR